MERTFAIVFDMESNVTGETWKYVVTCKESKVQEAIADMRKHNTEIVSYEICEAKIYE